MLVSWCDRPEPDTEVPRSTGLDAAGVAEAVDVLDARFERVQGVDGRRRDFYVRQLRDWKGIAVPEDTSPKRMARFARLCGGTLARAHARSGDRIAIAAHLGGGDAFDRALVTFSELYADQNEKDHQALVDAIRTGRVPAEAA